MHHYSILAILAFSGLTTVAWIIKKIFVKNIDTVPFILLETYFVTSCILLISYYYLGHEKFMNVPSQLNKQTFKQEKQITSCL